MSDGNDEEFSAPILAGALDSNNVNSEFAGSEYSVLDPNNVMSPSTTSESQFDYGAPVEVEHAESPNKFSWKTLWSFTGPGFLMSIAYLDPGNLESDLQAGAIAGYKLIWVLFWATVMGFAFQVLAVRLGVVTGRDLAKVCRREYPRPVAMTVWISTELAIIGSDIQEVVGSAVAFKLLFGLPLWAGVMITAADTFTFMLIHAYGVRKLEAFFCFLITVMAICFCVQFIMGRPDGVELLKGWVVPEVDSHSIVQATGMLGAVIMPHNIFLHSALVLSRKVDRSSVRAIKEANYYFSIESAISLAVSFLINVCVVAVFAKGFYHGTPNKDIGLLNAGDELRGAFGNSAYILWGIGLLAAGQSSTMTGTFAGQYVMQGFLNLKIAIWKRTLITRSVALVPAMTVALIASSRIDLVSEYLNILQSIQLPFAILPVLVFNSSEHIMGTLKLSKKMQYCYWFMLVIVFATNFYLVVSFSQTDLPQTVLTYVMLALFGIGYIGFVLYLVYLSIYPHRGPKVTVAEGPCVRYV